MPDATPSSTAPPDRAPSPTTIHAILERAVERDPGGVFYLNDGDGDRITFAEVHERSNRAARELAGLGLGPGDRLVVWLPNGARWIELLFASARLGVVLVTAGARLRMADMPYLIEHSQASAIVYTPRFLETDYESMVLELLQLRDRGRLPTLNHAIRCADGEAPQGTTAYGTLRPAPRLPASPDPGAAAVICYTGGTTGRPKGCVHDHRTIARNCTIASGLTGFAPGEKLVSAMPFAHVFGFHMGILQPMAGGASLIEAEPFSADRVLDLIEKHRGTVLYGVPAMGQAVVAAQMERPRDLSSLRVTLLAGAPVPAKLRSQVMAILGCGLTVVYGATESPTLTQLLPEAPPAALLESVGRATPGVELAILEPGTNRPLPNGQIGEIGARGYNHMVGYLDDPEATREKYRGEWIIPGDHGRLDENGFLYVTGRSEDMFLCGGFNVYPREVESQLEQLDGDRGGRRLRRPGRAPRRGGLRLHHGPRRARAYERQSSGLGPQQHGELQAPALPQRDSRDAAHARRQDRPGRATGRGTAASAGPSVGVPHMTLPGRPYSSLAVGEELWGALTVTETHVVLAAGVFNDPGPNHINRLQAESNRFGTQIAHGTLLNGIMLGILGNGLGSTIVAMLELTHPLESTHPARRHADRPLAGGREERQAGPRGRWARHLRRRGIQPARRALAREPRRARGRGAGPLGSGSPHSGEARRARTGRRGRFDSLNAAHAAPEAAEPHADPTRPP